jgi:hypothetical protein
MKNKPSLLSRPYPDAEQWKKLLSAFSPEAIAHKLLLASVPYVFRKEPLKFALFRKTIADAFNVDPTDIFIVGSALAGRSLKAKELSKEYSADSDIDTLIISESLFTSQVMRSLQWVSTVTAPDYDKGQRKAPELSPETIIQISRLSMHACRGIWRPDSLPKGAQVREEFFEKFNSVSLKVLGLQLSEEAVEKVFGRVARSFECAVADVAQSLERLSHDLQNIGHNTDQTKVTPVK